MTNSTKLLSTLASIKGLPVLVIGDIILDRYVWGEVDRISPEAPVPVVEVKRVEDRLGGAANVVRNLVNLGASVSLVGTIGDDQDGRIVQQQLQHSHINQDGVLVIPNRRTALKTRVIAHSQQVVRIDHEDRTALEAEYNESLRAHVNSVLKNSSAVIVADYGKGVFSSELSKLLSQAKQSGELSLTKRPYLIDPHPRNYALYNSVNIIKPNRKEAEKASGIDIVDTKSATKAAKILIKRWGADMILITLGEGGMLMLSSGISDALILETRAREVFDVSGAGDTVAAVFGAALGVGADYQTAGELANLAAGIVVAEIGTAAISSKQLEQQIQTN